MICLLAGGTGGAKLARGIADVAGPGELIVIAKRGEHLRLLQRPDSAARLRR